MGCGRVSELDDLRREARRRHKAATDKISRLRKKGVDLGGSKEDQRRDLGLVKRYNTRQLRDYIGSLNNFTSRDNQYHSSANGIIKADRFKVYKDLEGKYNADGLAHFDHVADVFVPEA